jgi:hypothetical protein
VIELRTVVNAEDVDNPVVFLDPVDDTVGPAPGAVTFREWPEQWLANSVRADRKRGITELQHPGGNGFRKPLSNRPPCSRLENGETSCTGGSAPAR